MIKTANYQIEYCTSDWMIIRDIGPWDRHSTITNSAEIVVEEVIAGGFSSNMRLGYYDSNGDLGELIVENGAFSGFGPLTEKDIK